MRKAQVFSVIERMSSKYDIQDMCRFYHVSRSGYYDWKKREHSENKDAELIRLICECQEKNKNRYGYRRVTLWLKREKGLTVNKKKVLRITSRNNLMSAIRRRKIVKFRPRGNLRYENILNRDFHAETPNKKWVTDISYIIMPDGTLYLSAIRDLCGNFIVAHRVATRQDYSLVGNTIADALAAENPSGDLILHSDGGGQYRSFDHRKIIESNNITASMSKPATPGDNAMAENFLSIFKTECIYLESPGSIAQAESLTHEFVQYYNYERLQANGLTPYEVRQIAFEKLQNGQV